MKCPSCASQVPDGLDDCPACGVVFAKLKSIEDRRKKEAAEALAALDKGPEPPAFPHWLGKAIAAGLALLWLGLMGGYWIYYLTHRNGGAGPSSAPAISPAPPEFAPPPASQPDENGEVRDPKTGEMRPAR